MRNITVSVSDEQYRRARIRAAEQGTSISALVSGFLASIDNEDARFAALEAQQRAVQSEIKAFSGSDRLDRDDIHERIHH